MPRQADPLAIDIPRKNELVALDSVLESLSDLAERRDALRLMAERATQEADKVDKELSKVFESHRREIASLHARIIT